MKKIIALMLAVVFALSMIACSSDNAKTTSTAETKTEAKTVDADSTNKDEKKTLVMGTSANFPPYEYIENEKITGIDRLRYYLPNEQKCRALGFCATKEHARYMAECFNACGLRADYLTADRNNDRDILNRKLAKGETALRT